MAEAALDIGYQSKLWLCGITDRWTDDVLKLSPVAFSEQKRYLPQSVTPFPGHMSFDRGPMWIEIMNNLDVESEVREFSVKKGVQVFYTTNLESGIFYVSGCVKTSPAMLATATLDLANARMENNIIPMFQQSGMNGIFVSSDESSSRKRAIKKASLQWEGGGYLIPFGAQTANAMRSFSIQFMFMDEVDAWPDTKRDGDPIKLFKDRCAAFWESRKIMIGSTPLLKGSSRIDMEYERGDQRKYFWHCLKCGAEQIMKWSGTNKDTGRKYGMAWDSLSTGELDVDSVRYECIQCGEGHQEYDKSKMFSLDNAKWIPTAVPIMPNIRSYEMPALLSAFQPWYKCVASWLDAWDVQNNRCKDVNALQVFYNNVLAESFEVPGSKISLGMASAHRRMFYRKGEIVNTKIEQFCDSKIVLLTCSVDVHKHHLFVSIWGWTAGMACWLIDYFKISDDSVHGLEAGESPAWKELDKIILRGEDGYGAPWIADDGTKYKLALTLIDSGYLPSTVCEYCSSFTDKVHAIVGRERTAKFQTIKEFAEFKTMAQGVGYRILVDHYKDRIAPVLRREWMEVEGKQKPYTFNAPVDITTDELKELTRETKRPVTYPDGSTGYKWHRPQGAANELWDLMVYGHASVEILAWKICVQHYKMEDVDWVQFWKFLEAGYFFDK